MKSFFLTFLFLSLLSVKGQNLTRTYRVEGKTFEIEKMYAIHEIILNSDSTYIMRYYKIDDKSQRLNYKKYKPLITKGTFRKKGDFYFFNYNDEDLELGRYKISESKITYYYDWKNGKIRKGAEFKRFSN